MPYITLYAEKTGLNIASIDSGFVLSSSDIGGNPEWRIYADVHPQICLGNIGFRDYEVGVMAYNGTISFQSPIELA
jgi:hypothetical protein